MDKSAVISPCGKYRYSLSRSWSVGPKVVFIMLNPSTADAEVDDPTIRKCIAFGEGWDFGRLVVVNLFNFRSPFPKDLLKQLDPIGPDADTHLLSLVNDSHTVICAWGVVHKKLRLRIKQIMDLLALKKLHCLGTSKDGFPRHPLYLPADTMLKEFDVTT